MHQLCTLMSENNQLTVLIYWQQCKGVSVMSCQLETSVC